MALGRCIVLTEPVLFAAASAVAPPGRNDIGPARLACGANTAHALTAWPAGRARANAAGH